jgi:mono/diheme cytochrome c family protein
MKMPRSLKSVLLGIVLSASIATGLRAENGPDSATPAGTEVRYNRDIRPILSNRCFKCHGPDLKKGGLDLQSRDSATRELKSGHIAVVPGKSADSELITRVSAEDASERMPPKGKGERLTPEQIAKLRAWIDQGARWEEHWAYVKPVRPPLPPVTNLGWVRNAIDRFVLARLDREGLAPSPEADRPALLRRASLDLIGLPPTPQEVDAFVSDPSPDAYEKAVDRLLASPHYGEHQARPWLDQARYADTNGYEKDDRRTIWPYRDWVIRAFNRDLPFDRFTIEQIAGDLLPGATPEQRIATGFHRNSMVNTEGGTDDEEFRVAAVVDRVNTTMEVWMGTTIHCAQCHNHKYDPFTQAEFYRLFAFFNSTEDRGRSNEPILPLPTPEQAARQRQLQAEIARPHALPVTPDPLAAALLAKLAQDRLTALRKQEADIRPASTLVMKELAKPRLTHILIRGNHQKKGELTTPGVPAKLHPLPPSPQPLSAEGRGAGSEGLPNRLALARWLVDPNNPLVGRVTMNRIWARYFGRGFVETSEDFGVQGELPTHPELLDWLATELIAQKWSLKAMHRLIVTSATYRQSARVTPRLYERDPYNRLFARGPRFRMDAEMVRDNALAISGLLHRKIGGPSVFPYQPDGVWFNPYSRDKWEMSTNGDEYRRGLYTFWRRTAPYAAFMAFDAPSREVACERRPRTNTPLQALAILNDKAFVEPAAALARRLMAEVKGTEQDRAAYGFRLCVSREPSAVELRHLLELYRDNLNKYQKDPAAAKLLATSGLSEPPKEMDTAQLAAWTVVANVLLNLDETITKG